MKKVIFSLLVLGPVSLFAQQKSFTLTGELKNSPVSGGTVYLAYVKDGKTQLDSAQVAAGKYIFKGEINSPEQATLFSVSPMSMPSRMPKNHAGIFLEPLSFTVTHVDSFSNVVTSGSVANTEYSKLMKQLEPLIAKEQKLSADYREASSAGDTAKVKQIEKDFGAISNTMKEDVLVVYVKNNPASPIALFALQNTIGGEVDPAVVGPLFDHLSEANKKSEAGVALEKAIVAAKATSVGQMAPDFTQNDTLDKPVSLSSFRGSYVLVDFWASWCGPCRMENPNVVIAYNKYKGKGFKILSVSLDKPGDKDKWLGAIHKDGLAWQHVSDLQFWNNAVAKAYGVNSIPTNFLLDPQGKIVGKSLRGEELEKKLAEIYNN
jgi:peroxiredoxin